MGRLNATIALVLMLGALGPAARASVQAPGWAEGTAWSERFGWAQHRLSACRKATERDGPKLCDRFVAEAIDQIYGVTDFREGTGHAADGAVVRALRAGLESWSPIGSAGTQANLDLARALAEEGTPVLAVLGATTRGQLALILPGAASGSRAWKRRVPNAAMLFRGDPARSFIGRPLSYAFSVAKMEEVQLYVHERPAEPTPPDQTAAEPAVARTPVPDERPLPVDPAPAAREDQATGHFEKPPSLFEVPLVLSPDTGGEGLTPLGAHLDREQLLNARLSGTWCKSGYGGTATVTDAVVIDGYGKTMSWGLVDKARAAAFRSTQSVPILDVMQEGEIVGITYAPKPLDPHSQTVFFVLDGYNKLHESHVFDNATDEVFERNEVWRRCADQLSSRR